MLNRLYVVLKLVYHIVRNLVKLKLHYRMMIKEYDTSTPYYYEDPENYDIKGKSLTQLNHTFTFMVQISGSYWEIIIVPLIFLGKTNELICNIK